jgi:hypothetical protein
VQSANIGKLGNVLHERLDTETSDKARERSNHTLHMDWEMEKKNMHVVNIERREYHYVERKGRIHILLFVLLIVMTMI